MLQFWRGEDDRNMVVSALAQIEARSTICRLQRENRMTSNEASALFGLISDQMRRLMVQPMNPLVLDAASGLIDRHPLRALDAVQLGSAVLFRNLKSAQGMYFIASDHALLSAAKDEGFAIWDPCETDWS